MKRSIKTAFAVCLAVLAVITAAGLLCWNLFGGSAKAYYTQIDNSAVKEQHSSGGVIDLTGGLAYSYTLTCYDENGEGKEIGFGMSRKLREGAFICLEVVPVRGVVDWAEVRYDQLPAAVQVRYAELSQDT